MDQFSKIFKNPGYQQVFDADGVVKVPFLDPGQLEKLQAELSELRAAGYFPPEDKYHVTLLSTDSLYKKKVANLLRPVFESFQNSLLQGFRVITTNLIIKHPHAGEVPMHQNWSFVDEQQFTSLTIWCPLQDVDELNGALYFLKGSHRCFRDIYRGPQIPYFFIRYEDEIRPLFEPIYLTAGEALVFDDSILHYSPQNQTSRERTAIQCNVVPANVPVHYFEYEKKLLGTWVRRIRIEQESLLESAGWTQIRAASTSIEKLPFKRINLSGFKKRLNANHA